MSVPICSRERGCLVGGGNSPVYTWRGRIKGRQRQQRIQSRIRIWAERSRVEQVVQVDRSGVERKSECP